MRQKDRKWLEFIEKCKAGMYPGVQCDMIPDGPAGRLRRDGMIEIYVPHNSVHKDRWTITTQGLAALEAHR